VSSDIGASASMAEMQSLWPWWRNRIAKPLGIEAVPAQARLWGAASGQTGVTPSARPSWSCCAPRAYENGIPLAKARDMTLKGELYSRGGSI